MRSPIATLQELTIPMGAGTNTPAIYLGPHVPAELAAHYAPDQVVAAMIFRESAQVYAYLALVNPSIGLSYVAVGGIESVGLTLTEGLRWTLRSGFPATDVTRTVIHNLFLDVAAQLSSGATLTVASGGELIVDSGGFQSVYGDAKVYSGGRLIIDGGGGELQIQSGGLVTMGGKTISGGPITYNPTTTNFIKNNGSLTAKYKYLDEHHVRTWGRLDVGSSTVFSGPDINISLPVIPFVAPGGLGTFLATDASANQSYPGVTALFGSIMFMVAKTNNWSGSNPFVPATGDVFLWDILYEV